MNGLLFVLFCFALLSHKSHTLSWTALLIQVQNSPSLTCFESDLCIHDSGVCLRYWQIKYGDTSLGISLSRFLLFPKTTVALTQYSVSPYQKICDFFPQEILPLYACQRNLLPSWKEWKLIALPFSVHGLLTIICLYPSLSSSCFELICQVVRLLTVKRLSWSLLSYNQNLQIHYFFLNN